MTPTTHTTWHICRSATNGTAHLWELWHRDIHCCRYSANPAWGRWNMCAQGNIRYWSPNAQTAHLHFEQSLGRPKVDRAYCCSKCCASRKDVLPFSREGATRNRRPLKVYMIDCAICSLWQVDDTGRAMVYDPQATGETDYRPAPHREQKQYAEVRSFYGCLTSAPALSFLRRARDVG